MINKAIIFATQAHEGQMRKYNMQPFILHPLRVMAAVAEETDDEDMLVAAVLHDAVEDTDITIEEIEKRFKGRVAEFVYNLTNQYTKEKHPNLNRLARKELEIERLAFITPEAALIKSKDIEDNTRHIEAENPEFAETYCVEKYKAMQVLYPLISEWKRSQPCATHSAE